MEIVHHKKELWALMWAMEKLCHYLLSRKFFAKIDHKPLVAMLNNKITPLIKEWMDILKFDFTTIHYPGEENLLADALSKSHESIIIICFWDKVVSSLLFTFFILIYS